MQLIAVIKISAAFRRRKQAAKPKMRGALQEKVKIN
jgi:hypothetical protein